MLVLSRRIDERVVLELGDGRLVWLTVCDVRHGPKVRIGIDAPGEVKVWREELWPTIERERAAAKGGA